MSKNLLENYGDCFEHKREKTEKEKETIKNIKGGDVESSLELIKKALEEQQNPVISYSGGKDSIVILDLVHKIDDSIPVFWGNTKIHYPETVEFVKSEQERLGFELIEGTPEKSFWEIVRGEGWGFERKGDRSDGSQSFSEKCCYHIKHKPVHKAIEKHEWDLLFAGLRADEGWQRHMAAKRDGDYFYAKSWNLQKCHPILWWTDEDIWNYIEENDLPYNPIYDIETPSYGKPRTGCWPCPLIIKYGYLEWLREYNEKMFRKLLNIYDLGEVLLEKKAGVDEEQERLKPLPSVDEIIENNPRFFDKIE